MNITFIDFDDIKNPLLGAGQGRATYFVGRQLVNLGHNVSVFCSRYPGSHDRVEDGVNYKHIGLGSKYLRLNNAFFFIAAPLAVRAIKKADIIIECLTAPISVLLSPLFTKIPVVALPSMFNAIEFTNKYHLPFHLYEKWGLKFYKYMMPYSNVDNSKTKKINPNIITHIVSQGVSDEFFKIPRKKAKYILYFGRLDIRQKGVDLLLDAYKSYSTYNKFPLVIAGHGVDQHKIEKIVKSLNLTKKVKLIGPIYGQKKADVFSNTAYVVFPSRHDEISLATLEVLAAGIPVVCFDLPESKWLNETVALKAKPFDIKEYNQKMLLMSEEINYIRYGKKARSFAYRFNWKNVAKEFESFFKTIKNKYEK